MLLDLFVQVGILEGGTLGLQYGRGHPNILSVPIELDIGGVAEDAELDVLAKPVLVDEDTAEVGDALVDGTVRGGGHYGVLEVGLGLADFVEREESKVRVLSNQSDTVMQDTMPNYEGGGCTLTRTRNFSQRLLSNLLLSPLLPIFFSTFTFFR